MHRFVVSFFIFCLLLPHISPRFLEHKEHEDSHHEEGHHEEDHHEEDHHEEHDDGNDYNMVRAAVESILSQPLYDLGSLGPVFVRLAWHSSGTYDKNDGTGGSDGATMRFEPERSDPANSGLLVARAFLDEVKSLFPDVSYADLWILAAYVSIEKMGGPHIEFTPGRDDAFDGSACPANGRLPNPDQTADEVRATFGRMGFNDQEIVVLIGGGHTIGKCHFSNTEYEGPWTPTPLLFNNQFFKELLDETWTVKNWSGKLQYENGDKSQMMLPSDLLLRDDAGFRVWTDIYYNNLNQFMEDFAKAYKKLTELGFHHGH